MHGKLAFDTTSSCFDSEAVLTSDALALALARISNSCTRGSYIYIRGKAINVHHPFVLRPPVDGHRSQSLRELMGWQQ